MITIPTRVVGRLKSKRPCYLKLFLKVTPKVRG